VPRREDIEESVRRVDIQLGEEGIPRKQRREQARARRKALEEAQAARAARRTRLTLLAIVIAIVLSGIVGIVIASPASNTVKKITPESHEARAVGGEVSALLAGIPQHGIVLGQPTAPVTLQYFGDLQCPVCKAFTLTALPSITRQWVRSGQLRVEYHSLETATREPEVFEAQQVAALAAGDQNRMWNFLEIFYHEQQEEDTGYVTESYIQGIARQVPGLSLARWTVNRSDPTLLGQLSSDGQTASSRGLNGTPAFLIGRTGAGTSRLEPSSYTEPSDFDKAIEKLVKG
jgi:protein-disulfide isomerase